MVALLDNRIHVADVAVPHHLVYHLLAVIVLKVLVVIVLVAFLVSIHVLAAVFVAGVCAVIEIRVLLLAVLDAVVGQGEW